MRDDDDALELADAAQTELERDAIEMLQWLPSSAHNEARARRGTDQHGGGAVGVPHAVVSNAAAQRALFLLLLLVFVLLYACRRSA